MNNKQNLTLEETFKQAIQNHQKNNFQIAENLYKEILKKETNHFESVFYLGTLYAQTKRFDLAKLLLLKAIQIQPNFADAHNNFGNVLKELGEYQKAKDSYEKAIQIQPKFADAHNNLGNALKDLGEYRKAINSYNNAINIKPNLASAHYNLGLLNKELGEYLKSKNSYEKAIQIYPNYADAHNNLGNALKELGEYQRAKDSYEKAIKIQPNLASAYYNLGLLQKELGDYKNAKNSLEMAVKYKPENLVYFFDLSELDEKILDSNLKNKIYEIIERSNSTKKNIAYGNFLLSKYEFKNSNYKNEFDYLLKGHQYYLKSKEKQFKKGIDYWLNILPNRKELIDLDRYISNINKENYLMKPIFIIGVPRCGSTLIEKVIASGSQYIPIGEETGIIHNAVKNLINDKKSLNSDIENFHIKITEAYNKKGLIEEKSNYVFTDKSLENFFYIDIIKKIFPQAKVINCRRNILSSIMSTLRNNQVFQAWAHNLEHIFKYYDIYHQTIKDFEKINPNFIYDLEYEKFINDPENESKKLMKFCDLTWDIKCLEFYKRKDLISKTASNIQIRKAIYKDSLNKYLPYKTFLSEHGNKYQWFN